MRRYRLATLISVLGVVLTTASVIASVAQYKVADLQAQAAVLSLAPQIEVRSQLVDRDSKESRFPDYDIVVSSDGGPVRNYDSAAFTWLDIGSHSNEGFKQPLWGYFQTSATTGRQKGELETFLSEKNQDKLIALTEAAKGSLMTGQSILGPTTLLRVTYRDAFAIDQREYFLIFGKRVNLLAAEDGETRWRELEAIPSKKVPLPISLNKMNTPQQVKDRAELLVSAFSQSR